MIRFLLGRVLDGLVAILGVMRGRAVLAGLKGRAVWLSGACWAVMFTAFMVALSLTTVANVLVTMSTRSATPKCAGVPRPFGPSTPVAWLSSTMTTAS